MEPDRLESWFVAGCDAEAGSVIAEQIVHQAGRLRQDEQQNVDSTQELANAGGKGASPVMVEALQAVVDKPIVGTKRRVPSDLELLTAQRADALVAEGDKSPSDGKAPKPVSRPGEPNAWDDRREQSPSQTIALYQWQAE